jgi:ribosomal protein S18 acetylase RimI-like enzyme
MLITDINTLSAKQCQEVCALYDVCVKHDGNGVSLYQHSLHEPRYHKSTVLAYDNNALVGFLRAFFFYPGMVEVALFIVPHKRKQGLARKLVQKVLPLLQSQGIVKLVFSVVPNINFAAHLNLKYDKSEYQMTYNWQAYNAPAEFTGVRLASMLDIKNLCLLEHLCFVNTPLTLEDYFTSLLNDNKYVLLVLEHSGSVIAKSHIIDYDEYLRFTNIGVLPQHQGLGFGRTIIAASLAYVAMRVRKPIYLDVETQNAHAVKLYADLGFIVKNSTDYYYFNL